MKYKSFNIQVIVIENEEAESKVPCGDCHLCCEHHSPLLTEEEFKSGVYYYSLIAVPDYLKRPAIGVMRINGGCVYFKDNCCSIYENRPFACRQFDCRKGHSLNPIIIEHVKSTFGETNET